MAKVKAGLLGFGAAGRLGKELVYTDRREGNVVRELVVPRDPESAAQLVRRAEIAAATANWREGAFPLTDDDREAYRFWVRKFGLKMSGFNRQVQAHIAAEQTGQGYQAIADIHVTNTLATNFTIKGDKRTMPAPSPKAWVGVSFTTMTEQPENSTGFTPWQLRLQSLPWGAGTRVWWKIVGVNSGDTVFESGLYTDVLT